MVTFIGIKSAPRTLPTPPWRRWRRTLRQLLISLSSFLFQLLQSGQCLFKVRSVLHWQKYRNLSCSNKATNYSCDGNILVGSNGEYDLHSQEHPSVDKHLRFDLVWIYHGCPGRTSSCTCAWGRPFLMTFSGTGRRSIVLLMILIGSSLFTQEVPARAIGDANVPVW